MIRRDGFTDTVMLDFDSVKDASQVMARFPFIAAKLELTVESCSYSYSSSGRGIHVVISLSEWIPPFCMVALQGLCGSDFRRETFNLVRVRSLSRAPMFWRTRWNVLYSEKFKRSTGHD